MSVCRKIIFVFIFLAVVVQHNLFAGDKALKILVVDSSRPKAQLFLDCLAKENIPAVFESENANVKSSRDLLDNYDAVVYSAEANWKDFTAIEEYVRSGGGLVLVSNTKNRDQEVGWAQMKSLWLNGPNPWSGYIEKDGLVPVLLNRLSPSVFVEEGTGMYAGYGPTRFGEIKKHPVTDGIDFSKAPLLPYHCNVRVRTHPIYTGTMRLPWPMEGFYKPIINTDAEEIAWSTNCEKHPLISVCNYGNGRVLLFGAAYNDAAFYLWDGSSRFWKQAVAWAGGNQKIENAPEKDTVVVLGEDEYRYQLADFGLKVLDKLPAETSGIKTVVLSKNWNEYVSEGGSLVWQIGNFDGKSDEFPIPGPNADQYKLKFPNDVDYNVAGDDWRNNWSGVHFGPRGISGIENQGKLVHDFKIRFNLDNPQGKSYLLTINFGKVRLTPDEFSVEVNGNKRFFRSPRQVSLVIPSPELQAGANTIILRLEKGGYLTYDALKLEQDAALVCKKSPEYDRLKKYVEGGGNLIVLDPSVFESESLREISPFSGGENIIKKKTDAVILQNWLTREDESGLGYIEKWYQSETAETGWSQINVNGKKLPESGSEFYHPETWYRTRFTIPSDSINKEAHLQIQLGIFNGYAYYGSYYPELYYVAQDIIPEVFINGVPVKRSDERWGTRQHQLSIFNLAGLLKEGDNTIAFKTRYFKPYGLDINVQKKLNYGMWAQHELDLPCVTFNDDYSLMTAGVGSPLADYLPDYHLWRTRVYQPGKDGKALLRWKDNQPALVEAKVGAGRILSFTSDLSEHLKFQYGDPPITVNSTPNWTRAAGIGWAHNSEEVQSFVFRNNYQVLIAQPTQLIGALCRYADNQPKAITAISLDPLARKVKVVVNSGEPGQANLKLMYKLFNWEKMLLEDKSLTVPLDKNRSGEVELSLPGLLDKTGYGTTAFKDQFLLQVGVGDVSGNSVDYLEKILNVDKPALVSISTDDLMTRTLPEAIPGNPHYKSSHVKWLSFHESTDSFVYVPGETANLSVNVKNTTDQKQNLRLKAVLFGGLKGTEKVLVDNSMALSARQETTLKFQEPLKDNFELYQVKAEIWIDNKLADKSERIFDCINPWKKVVERDAVVHRYGGGRQWLEPYTFVKHFSIGDVTDLSKITPDFDEWRSSTFLDVDADGGSRFGKEYQFDFPWGSSDKKFRDAFISVDSCSYFPNGELFNAWFFKDYKPQGEGPATVDTADFWSYYGLMQTFPNVVRFQEWMKEVKKIEVGGDTFSDIVKLINQEYLGSWYDFSWQSTYQNWAALLTPYPEGSNLSQQADINLTIFGINTVDFANQATKIIQIGRQDPCLDRVGAGTRWRTFTQSAFKGIGPFFHNQNYRTTGYNEPAMGQNGFTTGDNYQRMLYDWVCMTGFDNDGNISPVLDIDTAKTNDFTGSIYGNAGYSMGPYDWVMYDRIFRLTNIIQPEEPLGPVMVTRVERVSDGGGNLKYPDETVSGRKLFESLRNYGVSVTSFISPRNLSKLHKADGLVYLVPPNLPPEEANELVNLKDLPKALVHTTGRTANQGTVLDALLGLEYSPGKTRERLTYLTGDTEGTLYAPGESEYTASKGVELLNLSNGKAGIVLNKETKTLFCGLPTSQFDDDTIMRTLSKGINELCGNPVSFGEGVAGYGFKAQGKTFLVLEEMWGHGRKVEIRLKVPKGEFSAVNMNTNDRVETGYEDGYLVLFPLLRPHEGALVVVSQKGEAQ